MRTLLRLFLQNHDIWGLIVHWRLSVPMVFGAAAACIVWAVVPSHLLGAIAWVLIVRSTTGFGIIWDRGTPYT